MESSEINDNSAYRFPVSVKGVVLIGSQVVLLKNERNEWELPGGKLEPGESPEICVVREIEEELSIKARLGPLVDAWVYNIAAGVDVFIVAYGCLVEGNPAIVCSSEHKEARLFDLDQIDQLNMPELYRRSIRNFLSFNPL